MTKQAIRDELRITKRLIAYIVLFVLFFTSLVTAIGVFHQNNNNKRFLAQHRIYIKNKQFNILADALWLTNKSDIKEQMQIMLATNNIAYIAVYDSQQVLTAFGQKPKDNFKTISIPLFHFHRNQNRQVGQLKIYATLKAEDKRLPVNVWFILMSNGLKMFLLAGVVLWILDYTVIRNLQYLFQQITLKNSEVLRQVGFEKKHDVSRAVSKVKSRNDTKAKAVEQGKEEGWEEVRGQARKEPKEEVREKTRDQARQQAKEESRKETRGEPKEEDELDLLTNSVNDMQLALISLKTELRDNKELHAGITQSLSEGLVSLDANLNIIGLNDAAEILLGYCEDELEGGSLHKLFSDNHYNEVSLAIKTHQKIKHHQKQSLQGVIDGNARVFTIQKKAGDEVSVNLSFIEFTASQQTAWVMVLKDLTYQSVHPLPAYSANLLHLINASTNFMALYDNDLNMIYINKSGLALSEMSSSTTDNRELCLGDLLPKDDQLLFNHKIKPTLACKSYWRGEHNLQTYNGRIVPVMAEYSRLGQDQEKSEVLAVIMFDLSLQKKKESEFDEHLQQLNALLQRRTHELEAVNQELDSFSYSVSHDLRAPLRAIMGFSRILKEESLESGSTQIQDWAERIEKNSERMASLIQGLLTLARVTRSELDPKPIDMSAVVNRVLQRLKSAEPKRDVLVRVEDGMSVIADNPLVEVVMSHLLENAWKYTGHEAQAEIECSSCIKGGERYFCIRDNGVGINMKYADKLFSPFQCLHAKEEFPGAGIGLATVKRVLSRHGGNIFVEAEMGVGARFYFRFSDSVAEKVDDVPLEV